eukprot:gnl/MRDRNA2_/MRDRNA2_34955_c0_seq1.p1 gnl/MRDRNA2_/MRDRNA2_34955_c0~~gnl/MRDRNA2_/MRDRNA2_34955_c0_seq1.p1  ORF type:complete len:364 (+),score=77.34 gnl/MRDRNA2_/MRDRNA2_34955_c0_seq1:103-1194(+)
MMRALGVESKHGFGEAFIPLNCLPSQNRPAFASPPFQSKDLQELNYALPTLDQHDLLVKVHAAGVNPLDFKERQRGTPISGYDVAGTVVAVGSEASKFKVGDAVWYMGSVLRQGGFAEFHAVDERLVSLKPSNLQFSQAAGVPLCLLTAWECLEEKLGLTPTPEHSGAGVKKTILISPGAGGVGSIAIQLAKKVFNLSVIATASREETVEWCRNLGADHVVSHKSDLASQLDGKLLDFVLTGKVTDEILLHQYLPQMKPGGKIVTIDAPGVMGLKENVLKSLFVPGISLLTEFIFTKPIYDVNPEVHGRILAEAKELFEKGLLKNVVTAVKTFSAAGLKEAQDIMERGDSIGKIVLQLASQEE